MYSVDHNVRVTTSVQILMVARYLFHCLMTCQTIYWYIWKLAYLVQQLNEDKIIFILIILKIVYTWLNSFS